MPIFTARDLLNDAIGRGNVGPPIQDRGVESVRDRSQSGQFPVAEMGRKDERRLAVEPQLRKQFVGALLDFDAAILGVRGIVLPDMVEMGEFCADATEIVPDTCENGLDLFW